MPAAPICTAAGVQKADPLDIVYAERLRTLADTYPDDADILVLYVEAVMIATRGDWWDRKTARPPVTSRWSASASSVRCRRIRRIPASTIS